MEPDLESIEPRSRSSRWIWKPRSWKGVGGSMSINKYLYYYYYYFLRWEEDKGDDDGEGSDQRARDAADDVGEVEKDGGGYVSGNGDVIIYLLLRNPLDHDRREWSEPLEVEPRWIVVELWKRINKWEPTHTAKKFKKKTGNKLKCSKERRYYEEKDQCSCLWSTAISFPVWIF